MKRLFLLFAAVAAIVSCAPKAQDNAEAAPEQSAPVKIDHAAYSSPNAEGQQRVYDYLKAHGPFFITTVDGDQPRVRPFGALHIFEGKMYIITGHVKRVAKQLAANPKVEVCALNGTEWVRVAATLVEDERVGRRSRCSMPTPTCAAHITRMMTTLPFITLPMLRLPSRHLQVMEMW